MSNYGDTVDDDVVVVTGWRVCDQASTTRDRRIGNLAPC